LPSTTELQRLVHELQVHQIELEMQNEELVYSREQAEALKDRYFEFYDFSPTGFVSLDPRGAIIQANLTCARLLGRERALLVGRAFASFLNGMDQAAFGEFLHRVFATPDRQACEVALERRGLTPLFVQIEGVQTQGGRECRAVLLDLSAHRRSEEERVRMQEQLFQAQKIESVGHLAGGIAHDFNNMLGVILGHAEMALECTPLTLSVHEDLREIRKAAERSAELTSQLLAFARLQPVIPRVLDLNATVAGMLTMLIRLISETIDVVWLPGEDLWPVRMDPTQVNQLLTNLCINARDAIADVGQVTIRTENVTVDADYLARCDVPGAEGDFVVLTVEDTGRGMAQETRARIFEPFFTTKEMGKGTGLGLATVAGVVNQNNGFIVVESGLGQGSSFRVHLPRSTGRCEPIPAPPTADYALPGLGAVLVVEDKPELLDVTKCMLERLGCRVLTAGSPCEAIRLVEKHGAEINLLLTDVVMPGMNGRELANRLLELQPRLKLVFMSGYTADLIGNHGLLDDRIHFLQKPFLLRDLSGKLREALNDG